MATAINVDIVEQLLEFEPRREDGAPVDLADPPRNADGRLICGRERSRAGGPCGHPVGIPWVCCDLHEPLDPIATPTTAPRPHPTP